MAQPGRAVVRQDRARRDRSRRIHPGARSQEKAHALHPQVRRASQVRAVEVLRHNSENYSLLNHYSPLAIRLQMPHQITSGNARKYRAPEPVVDAESGKATRARALADQAP